MDIRPLTKLNNALASTKISMDHPRMDAHNQWWEVANMMHEIACDKKLRKELRQAISLLYDQNRLLAENETLRLILAKSNIPCIYCSKENMAECERGFPGCAKADDIIVGEEYHMERLLEENRKYKEALQKLRDDRSLWQKPRAGGQDKYAGMPPGMRVVDEALND